MKLPKWAKILIGFLSFLPFFLVIAAFGIAVISIIAQATSEEPLNIFALLAYLQYVLPVMLGYLGFYLTFGIFYLVHIILNKALDTEKKVLWIIIILTLNALSMPFYWYIHIWKEPLRSNAASGPDYDIAL